MLLPACRASRTATATCCDNDEAAISFGMAYLFFFLRSLMIAFSDIKAIETQAVADTAKSNRPFAWRLDDCAMVGKVPGAKRHSGNFAIRIRLGTGTSYIPWTIVTSKKYGGVNHNMYLYRSPSSRFAISAFKCSFN